MTLDAIAPSACRSPPYQAAYPFYAGGATSHLWQGTLKYDLRTLKPQ